MSLFMLKRHTGRSGGTAILIVHLVTRWAMSGNCRPWLLYHEGKDTWQPLTRDPEPAWIFYRGEKSLAFARNCTSYVQPIA
jgi:hypothetical protein